MAPDARDDGFSLVELLVATLLTLVIAGAVFALVNPAETTAVTHPDAIDAQQRARVAADVVLHDLLMAGAGLSVGASAGPLSHALPPIVPRRMGLQGADAPSTARTDAVTITHVPSTLSQTTLRAPLVDGSSDLILEAAPNCPLARPLCGLAAGATILVFDRLGHFDAFDVTQVTGEAGRVHLRNRLQSTSYQPGDVVTEADVRTYYFDRRARQLRQYDGNVTDVPVIDNVVGLSFEYFGDPDPPTAPRPPPGAENCLYDAAGSPKPLPRLPPQGGSLAPLPLAMFTDGPWCGAGSTQFDADLLRVRKVRVSLRVQVVSPAMRTRGPAFAQSGSSRSSSRSVPDVVLTFDVSPRNLNLGR